MKKDCSRLRAKPGCACDLCSELRRPAPLATQPMSRPLVRVALATLARPGSENPGTWRDSGSATLANLPRVGEHVEAVVRGVTYVLRVTSVHHLAFSGDSPSARLYCLPEGTLQESLSRLSLRALLAEHREQKELAEPLSNRNPQPAETKSA
jgi:hypothetical protein